MGCCIASTFASAGVAVVIHHSEVSRLRQTKQNCHAAFLEMAVTNPVAQPDLGAAEEKVGTAESLAEISKSEPVTEEILRMTHRKAIALPRYRGRSYGRGDPFEKHHQHRPGEIQQAFAAAKHHGMVDGGEWHAGQAENGALGFIGNILRSAGLRRTLSLLNNSIADATPSTTSWLNRLDGTSSWIGR